MQSCANGGAPKTEASSSENSEYSDSSEYSENSDSSDPSDAKKPGYRIFIEGLLQDASKKKSDTCFPLFFAREFLDVPYVAHTLEVNDQEELVINVRELDCTTLVETVTALTLCAYQKQFTFAAYQNNLRNMRYYNGVIDGYPSRIHYFTDWIVTNQKAGIVSEIQQPNPPFTAVQTVKVSYMSEHPQSYKALKAHPEYVTDTGLDIAHLGFAVWQKDGLHLLNASQLHKKVVEEPMTLYQYLQKHPSHTGIRIIRINHK